MKYQNDIYKKGTHQYKEINYKDLPLIKELETWYKNNNHNEYEYFFNPEIRWFRDIHFLYGIPIYWLKEFKLISCITQSSSHQSSFNGPDYIFKYIKTNKLIGFEIVSYKWNVFDSFKNTSNIKEFAKNKYLTPSLLMIE